jgi:hypothetical protein
MIREMVVDAVPDAKAVSVPATDVGYSIEGDLWLIVGTYRGVADYAISHFQHSEDAAWTVAADFLNIQIPAEV